MQKTPFDKTEADVDESIDETFPCSDPPAWGRSAAVAGCPKPAEMVAADLEEMRAAASKRSETRDSRSAAARSRATGPADDPISTRQRRPAQRYDDWEAGGGPSFEPDYRGSWQADGGPARRSAARRKIRDDRLR